MTDDGGHFSNTIRYQAFAECHVLQNIAFDEGSILETIESHAFEWSKIASLALPGSVKTIGWSAFYGIPELRSMSFGDGSVLETIGNDAFANSRVTSVVFPTRLKSIGQGAFRDHHGVSPLSTISFAGDSNLEYDEIRGSTLYLGWVAEGLLVYTCDGGHFSPTGTLGRPPSSKPASHPSSFQPASRSSGTPPSSSVRH